LADAVDAGDPVGVQRAVRSAVGATPADMTDVVLGCTEYELVADVIATAFPAPVRKHGTRVRGRRR
jgi:glutamate racemase